jgi:nitronate monooxygenase
MLTRFTTLAGCRLPIQSAALGPISGVDLAGAVTGAGGLGMLGPQPTDADAFAATVDALAERAAGRPFGVNFLVPFLDLQHVEIAARRARVVEFFYGDPDPDLVRAGGGAGALVSWQVGSAEEARRAVQAGCDLVVAQGTEAGGHVRGTRLRDVVLAEVRTAVDVPVLAAGGLATPEAVAAVLAAGADGVRVGTAFLAATEADAHPDYVAAVLAAGGADPVLTTAFSTGWPDAPHRVLGSAVDRARAGTSETVGEIVLGEGAHPVPRFGVLPPTRAVRGDIAAMALYAGQGVGAVTAVRPAAEIVRSLTSAIPRARGDGAATPGASGSGAPEGRAPERG